MWRSVILFGGVLVLCSCPKPVTKTSPSAPAVVSPQAVRPNLEEKARSAFAKATNQAEDGIKPQLKEQTQAADRYTAYLHSPLTEQFEVWVADCPLDGSVCSVTPPPAHRLLPNVTKYLEEKTGAALFNPEESLRVKEKDDAVEYSITSQQFDWFASCNIQSGVCVDAYPLGTRQRIAKGNDWSITKTQTEEVAEWQLTMRVDMDGAIGTFVWTALVKAGAIAESDQPPALLDVSSKAGWPITCKGVSFYTPNDILQETEVYESGNSRQVNADLAAIARIASESTIKGKVCHRTFGFAAAHVEALRAWLKGLDVAVESPATAESTPVETVQAPKTKATRLWADRAFAPPKTKPEVKPKEKPKEPTYTPPTYTGPTCKKGCPCGNACIDCSKKCHK